MTGVDHAVADGNEHNPGTPWRRDPDEVTARLQRWVTHTHGPDARVVDVGAPGNGLSSETMLFSVAGAGDTERFAARLAPLPDVYPVFPEYDLRKQRRCMDLVREHTSVPTPVVTACELDPMWLGTPFLVMRRIDGEAPPDLPPYVFGGWVMDATPEQRARLQQGAVDVLAGLHALTAERVDLSFLARPDLGDTPLRRLLGYEREYYEWARDGVRYPLIEATFAWLDERFPAESAPALSWGDARIGNMLFVDFAPVAVLDWEMAGVGPAEVDLAWMIFLHRFFADLAERFEMPPIPGFMERADVVAAYERATGSVVRDLDWFEVFAALRFAIVSVRTSTRGIAYGQMEPPTDPDDLVMFRSLLERMISPSA
ncbi:MAG TPA: phosphotransferase family protein [Acidimicrobiia bacterium]|nr:phosphotransferase family protein [Acidimicrobiia bacterium]